MKPILYSVIDKDRLSHILETFYQCVEIPIQALDDTGSVLLKFGIFSSYCSLLRPYLSGQHSCALAHTRAGKKAMELGEPYIFSCSANMNHIIFPLTGKNTFLGSVLVGPFLMDKPDSLLFTDLLKRFSIPTETLLDMYEEATKLPVIAPKKVTSLSHLLQYLFSGLLSDSRQQLMINRQKLHQQSRISESIQNYKAAGNASSALYPYQKEKALIARVKAGNAREAKALLNDLLGYVFFAEGTNLEVIKARSIELCSLLSRAAIEGGATSDRILKINNQYLKNLQNVNNQDDLCYKLQECIDSFTECVFEYIPTKSNDLIRRAILYISRNLSAPLTLETVASEVHLNPSYFSTLFRQATGSTFREYVNMVRIEESKRLLANTEYSIIDIAVATGFEDQSYFSKVFKKYTGLTPRQYR